MLKQELLINKLVLIRIGLCILKLLINYLYMENNSNTKTTITVGQLKKYLDAFPNDMELYFGGLDFYRLNDYSGLN